MGVKSFNLHVRHESLPDVAELIERSELPAAFMATSGRGWITVAVDMGDDEEVETLGKDCSALPGGFAFSLQNFDEDMLMVDLYVGGEHVARLGIHDEEYFPADQAFGSPAPLVERLAMPVTELDIRRLLKGERPSVQAVRALAVASALEEEAASESDTDPDRIRAQVAMSSLDELLGEHTFPSQVASWLALSVGVRGVAAYSSYEYVRQDLEFGEGEFPGLDWHHVQPS